MIEGAIYVHLFAVDFDEGLAHVPPPAALPIPVLTKLFGQQGSTRRLP